MELRFLLDVPIFGTAADDGPRFGDGGGVMTPLPISFESGGDLHARRR